MSAQDSRVDVYLFPGQGADKRIFSKIELDSSYRVKHISYPVPERGTTLTEFAYTFIPEIDTSIPYILIGQSIGGMICTELADTLHPEKVIIISSAKSRNELPLRYRFQKFIPVYSIIPKRLIKFGGRILQPIVEPDTRKEYRSLFKAMLKAKEPKYLKRTIRMIVSWDRTDYNKEIIHIHGDKDKTIPIRNVAFNYKVSNGSHVMVYTMADEIDKLVMKEVHSLK